MGARYTRGSMALRGLQRQAECAKRGLSPHLVCRLGLELQLGVERAEEGADDADTVSDREGRGDVHLAPRVEKAKHEDARQPRDEAVVLVVRRIKVLVHDEGRRGQKSDAVEAYEDGVSLTAGAVGGRGERRVADRSASKVWRASIQVDWSTIPPPRSVRTALSLARPSTAGVVTIAGLTRRVASATARRAKTAKVRMVRPGFGVFMWGHGGCCRIPKDT
jgi:hypothetical protein